MNLFILLCAVFIGTVLGNPLDFRILGGQTTQFRGQFPYSISLQWGQFNNWQHHCGGAIISEHWIMTSASCVTEMPSFGARRVLAGLLDVGETITNNIQVVSIDYFVTHPNYTGSIAVDDIALIRVTEDFQFNDFVQPVTLPVANTIPSGQALLSGWGAVSTAGLQATRQQFITVPIYQYQDCLDALVDVLGAFVTTWFNLDNFCTGPITGGIGTCEGDQGDPLVQDDSTLIGLVSWRVTPCGTPGAPAVYTRISSYVDWIYEHVVERP